mmetsp:Transcript_5034/g.16370  ORF Transcript_5034/g.16370 Transcript_5034/m.16370 type:complete len:342 (-) Transcript_5034:125-1150(-)
MRALVPHHRDALVAAPPGSPLVARRPLRPRAVVRRQPVVLAVRVVGEGLLLARAEHVEASEDNEDGAEVERHQVGRVALLLVEHDVARDGARDDHEALEDGDHVQRLEGAQPDREQVERAAGECERDGDEEVRVGRQEGVLLAPSRGGRLGVAPVEGDALDHLDARLCRHHVACEEASERPGGEASPKVGPAPEVVEADGGDGGEADVVELRERAREEREILVDGPLVHEVVPEEARAGGAEDDQQRAALARGREHLAERKGREHHVPDNHHPRHRRDDGLSSEGVRGYVKNGIDDGREEHPQRNEPVVLRDRSMAQQLLPTRSTQRGDAVEEDAHPPQVV